MPAPTRRRAVAGLIGSGVSLCAQHAPQLLGEPPGRIPPVNELVNSLEMEAVARRKLANPVFAAIADSTTDRPAFDRLTFRPRLMVNTLQLDLSLELFGLRHFAPIIIGPASAQQRFHPDGELATARGASAAKAVMIVSDRASQPIPRIASEAASAGFYYQVFPENDAAAQRSRIEAAVQSGAKAILVTVTAEGDWRAIDKLRQGLSVPFVLKGITNARQAQLAIDRGVQGIVVSSYHGEGLPAAAPSISALPEIASIVAGRAPILIDGGFRRGSDVLKALSLGAHAVLVTRPVLWGLAGYGAPGVQHVLESLQTELARSMAMCGRPTLASIDKTCVRVHRR